MPELRHYSHLEVRIQQMPGIVSLTMGVFNYLMFFHEVFWLRNAYVIHIYNKPFLSSFRKLV